MLASHEPQAIFAALLHQAQPVLHALQRAGGQPLLVGGAVRDALLGHAAKDIDIEVYGLDASEAANALAPLGIVNAVGRSFGVLKVRLASGATLDVALPCRANQPGEPGTLPASDPTMTPREAAARRDFSWNALSLAPDGTLLDFFGGVADLRARVIRHVSDAFGEDPLRVLRAMQFAARFDFTLAPETAALCRKLLPRAAALPTERVWGEWWKWATLGRVPAAGLRALDASGWLSLYPALAALQGCPQDAQYHPEGDVWTHTLLVCDAAAQIADREHLAEHERAVTLFAALCHDLGKPLVTEHTADGRIRSPNHAVAGVPLVDALLRKIGATSRVVAEVLPLVREHSAHFAMQPTTRAVRRLAARLNPANLVQWGQLIEADFGGRSPLPPRNPAAPVVEQGRALSLLAGPPEPLLRGRDLIALGFAAGPQLGPVLRRAYEAQLDGAFATHTEALAWVAEHPAE